MHSSSSGPSVEDQVGHGHCGAGEVRWKWIVLRQLVPSWQRALDKEGQDEAGERVFWTSSVASPTCHVF